MRLSPVVALLALAACGESLPPDIGANNGIYACGEGDTITLEGDYGEGVRCPNPAYATDPKPSTCAA